MWLWRVFPRLASFSTGSLDTKFLTVNSNDNHSGGGHNGEGQAHSHAHPDSPCWSCRGSVDQRAPFCHACGMIQPARQGDEFQRLGMSPNFDLDPKELEKRYFAFQRKFHPDRFATKTPREKQLSLQHATDLNEAYDRLKAPLSRAEALLETKGAEKQDQARTESDPELLMEAMESREALADAETAEEVARLEAHTRMDIELSEEALSVAFAADDLEGATGIVTRLKYLLKLLQEIRRKRLVLQN
jgi:molecular chaperone HscB